MSSPVIPYADVTVYGSLDTDGETYRRCRLTMLGRPADVSLYSRVIGTGNWKIVDKLSGALVSDNPDGSMTIVGTSRTLVDEIGVSEADASVRWEVRRVGCPDCH